MKLLQQYILAALLMIGNGLYHCRCYNPLSIHFSGLVRLICPVLLFLFLEPPIAFILTSGILDTIEPAVNKQEIPYQIRDKIFDLWGYIISYVFLIINKPSIMMPYFTLLTILFVIRVVGNLSFIYSKNRRMLVYFPNFYEIAFIFLPFSNLIPSLKKYSFHYLTGLFMLKLMAELLMHYLPSKYKLSSYVKNNNFITSMCPGKMQMYKDTQTGNTNASNINTAIPLFEF